MASVQTTQPLVAALVIIGCVAFANLAAPASAQTIQTDEQTVTVATVAGGLEHPWGLAFLPDGSMLVTERSGRVRLVAPDGTLSAPLQGAPPTRGFGQGGMLDIALDPDFAETGHVFIAYSAIGSDGAGTAVWRARLVQDAEPALVDGHRIFLMNRLSNGRRHFGARIVFAPDKTLWLTIGDRGDRPRAQDANDHAGSVLRMTRDGEVPPDNPFVGAPADDYLWSIGHRNPQAAALNPWTQVLWTVSHGARGGDEVNIPEAGKNYGWPVISYGRHYSGFRIGEGTAKPGMEQPIHYWDPSIAPSGMAFYTADIYPAWRGNLFVGALKDQLVSRLTLDGDTIVAEEQMLSELGERIRDVRQGPDGKLYLLTDSPDGRILRLDPAD